MGAETSVNMQEVSSQAEGILREAGKLLLGFYGKTHARHKAFNDLVTEADTALESFILERLEQRFPGWQAISEERTAQGAQTLDEFCWVLDPLDGTINFASHIPLFCISLALLHKGYPVLGWVYAPQHQELFRARLGGGSFLNGKRLQLPVTPPSVIVGADTLLLEWAAQNGEGARLSKMITQFGRIRTFGCQALALCYVAAGRLRASATTGCKLWDDAAGALIIQEAAGRYTNWQGEDIFPLRNGSPILAGGPLQSIAAEPAAWSELVQLLR